MNVRSLFVTSVGLVSLGLMTVDDNKQKCDAFICDAITKKCRRRKAEIPQLPNLGGDDDRDDDDGIKLPSL